jgi:hypothetical protein
MAKTQKAAVISGDIIGSSKLNVAARRKLQSLLDNFSKLAAASWPDFGMEQYRGDSLQAILTNNRAAGLRAVLLLQSLMVKNHYGIRTAIGVGDISYQGKNIVTSDGTAFQVSGPYLDHLRKTGEVIFINLDNPLYADEWPVHSTALAFIIKRWTAQQAEAMYFQLQGYTQQEIAKQLKITQPSVHQRLQSAGWDVVQKILQRFEAVVPSL